MTSTFFGIRELSERARRIGAVDLTQGMIDAPPPEALTSAMQGLDIARCSAYTNKRGVPAYRQAIQTYLTHREWPVLQEQVMATSGTTAGVASALLAHCRPGDRVLLPEPFFIGHRLLLENLGFEIEFLPMSLSEPNWQEIADRLSAVQAAIVTSPHNPTGHVVPSETLSKLSALAAESNTLLIVDEMYREFIWQDEAKHNSDVAYANIDLASTVFFRSFSKTFAVPGWRIGWAVASSDLVEKMAATHDSLYLGGSTLAQHAATQALTHDLPALKEYISQLRDQLLQNKKSFEEVFKSVDMEALPVPAAYYMLLKHNRESDLAAVEELLERGVAVVPLSLLCSDTSADTGYVRIHFAVQQKTVDAVIEAFNKS